jgi:ABC-type glycerol-3-phosphate transport system substrate-binding protein
MKPKKYMILLLSLTLLISTSCQKEQQTTPKIKDEFTGKLVIWTDKESSSIFKASTANYKKLHEMVQVEITEIGSSSLIEKLDQAVQDKSELPDLICIQDENTNLLLEKYKNILEETDGTLKKDNYPGYKLNNLTIDNKLYGIPLTGEPALMLYRTDIAKDADLKVETIKTWTDYIGSSKKLTDKKKLLWLQKEPEVFYKMLVNQLGGNFVSSDNKLQLNTIDKIKAAELIKKLYSEGIIQGSGNDKVLESNVKKGTAVSFIVSPKDLKNILSAAPELKENLLVKNIPAFEEGGNEAISLGGENLVILKGSKNKKVALDFAVFAAEDRQTLKDLMTTLGVTPAYLGYYDETWYKENDWRFYARLLKEVYPFNFTKEYAKVKPTLKDSLTRIIVNGEESKAILDELQLKNLPIPSE